MRHMEHERRLLQDEKFTGWSIIWTLFAFKLGTIGIILFMMRNAASSQKIEAGAYIATSSALWVVVPIVAMSGFVSWRIRLRRARRKAKQLRQSEFCTIGAADFAPLTEDEKARLRQLPHLTDDER